MSVSVTILGLIKAGAESLIPADVVAHVEVCSACGEDAAPLWVFADKLADMDEVELEDAVRYMAKRGLRPNHWLKYPASANAEPVWEWAGPRAGDSTSKPNHLPRHLCPGGGSPTVSQYRAATWFGAVEWLAGQLASVRADLDTTQPPAMAADGSAE